ncbi:hypothetical protein J6590_031791 [Homalodisca vitripennis]|nr:hypothetical protein J6590_031791 [Homalodisca vitripennis]
MCEDLNDYFTNIGAQLLNIKLLASTLQTQTQNSVPDSPVTLHSLISEATKKTNGGSQDGSDEAFDWMSHPHILDYLRDLGLDCIALRWMSSFYISKRAVCPGRRYQFILGSSKF